MSAALTLMAKERGDVPLVQQVLFYPVTDASFDTGSYHQFADRLLPAPRRHAVVLGPVHDRRGASAPQITASPLRATTEQLTGLPPALVITGEADVLRDEGEAYADKLREAGVPVTAVRFQGIIHDFVMLNALRGTHAARGRASPWPPTPCAPRCTPPEPDNAINPEVERFGARRAAATVIEAEGASHAVAVSQPARDLAGLIMDAVRATGLTEGTAGRAGLAPPNRTRAEPPPLQGRAAHRFALRGTPDRFTVPAVSAPEPAPQRIDAR